MKGVISFIFLSWILINLSCKKESSCENCCSNSNKPPIAIAGPDQVITLPTDSISLDGTTSNDPDGTISVWLWTKISGPASFNIIKPTDSTTLVKILTAGRYQFELKVTDNGGLSSTDTIQIKVTDASHPNRPPVANAGPDQTVILPISFITLDASGSTDPDNNITSYLWSSVSGFGINFSEINALQLQVPDLLEGVYKFELKVVDAEGLFSKDSITVTVVAQPPSIPPCDNSNRPLINGQLIPFGTLSRARIGMAVASAGNKILFAGGITYDNNDYDEYWGTTRVDIYDIATQLWSIAELSTPRSAIATAVAGNKIFFAGGDNGDGAFNTLYSSVDIYDVNNNTWTVAHLSQPRSYIAAAAAGNKVFFAGGEKDWDYNTSAVVDIYDISTNTWSTATLSEPRAYICAVAVDDKVYFAGGHREDRWYANPSNRIDIYDNTTSTWSTSSLSVLAGGSISGIIVADKIYWSTGCNVEIKNINNGSTTAAYLFQPGGGIIDHGQNAVTKNDKIIYFRHRWDGQNDRFDIYNIATNTWSIGVLPQNNIGYSSIISVNNIIYIAGGVANGNVSNVSNQVWKLEF